MSFLQKYRRNIIGWSLIVSGCTCLVIAAIWFFTSRNLTQTALRATGQITRLDESDDHGSRNYYPTFVFTDRKGARHTVTSELGTGGSGYYVGKTINVLYPANDPNNARIDDWNTLWLLPILFGAAGAFNLLVGAVLCLWPRIRERFAPAIQA